MSILFFLIGFLALLVCVPTIIVYAAKAYRLRKKEERDSPALTVLNKRMLKVLGVTVVALLTMAVSTSFFPDEPTKEVDTVPARQESERPTQELPLNRSKQSTQVDAPAVSTDSKPQANAKESPQKPPVDESKLSPAPELEPRERFLPSVTSADVKLNLQKWGLEFGFDSGKAIDLDTGVELGASLFGELPLQVSSVDFYVDGTAMIGMLPAEDFLAVAGGYLGYCATLPYEDADPVAAREWVKSNVAKANQPGRPLETTFGSARYILYGGKYIRHLSIEAK
ncbi:MAG: hypothetical protein HPY71_14350 [Firmicutes bacterium]|nr:hypothetical protein [Bacillota bacterium]